MNIEIKYAPSNKFNLQFGGTAQLAFFSDSIEYYTSEDTDNHSIWDTRILCSPNIYGYFIGMWQTTKHMNLNISGNYTGSMAQPYESGLQRPIGIYDTRDFFELNLKLDYDFHLTDEFTIQVYTGISNIFNSYQDDFDQGVLRDSGYVYGPGRPRTFLIGLKIGNRL